MRKRGSADQDLTWRFWLEDFSSGIWALVPFFWCCVLPLCSCYQERTFPEPLHQMVAHLILVDTAACFSAFCSFFPLWVDLLRRGVKKQDQETWSHNLAWVPVKKRKKNDGYTNYWNSLFNSIILKIWPSFRLQGWSAVLSLDKKAAYSKMLQGTTSSNRLVVYQHSRSVLYVSHFFPYCHL